MTEPLVIIADQQIMGEIRRDRHWQLTFVYDDRWRTNEAACPLSLSMPLAAGEHAHNRIDPWLWGLLPDNAEILNPWGKWFHVSSSNAFSLLGEVGEDCAGAIQLVWPDRVEDVLRNDGPQVEWIAEDGIAERLRALRTNPAAWRMSQDTGQLCLAGAQPKTALLFDGQRWGVPYDPTPTTHILKPPIPGFDGHAENEHLCLELARAFGLPAAKSEVLELNGEVVIVVERYDRARTEDSIRRIHQEDLCQVLGIPPTRKYQNDGGPGCAELGEVIRTHSEEPEEDVRTFARAVMLNWIIGGTDAHAKNFSMLIGAGGKARLAPLYDMASVLPYNFVLKKMKMATRIGGEYLLEGIFHRHWDRFASEMRLPSAGVLDMGRAMAEALPRTFAEIVESAQDGGLHHPIMPKMVDAFYERAEQCARALRAVFN